MSGIGRSKVSNFFMNRTMTAQDWIAKLDLSPLPGEGGFFRRTFTSVDRVDTRGLKGGDSGSGDRALSTLIQFLLTPEGFSAMHRLPTAETWLWQLGDPLEMLRLREGNEKGQLVLLGPDPDAGQVLQTTVPPGEWQGTRLVAPTRGSEGVAKGFALVSCLVSPGFEDSDLELGSRAHLLDAYPDWHQAILLRTRLG